MLIAEFCLLVRIMVRIMVGFSDKIRFSNKKSVLDHQEKLNWMNINGFLILWVWGSRMLEKKGIIWTSFLIYWLGGWFIFKYNTNAFAWAGAVLSHSVYFCNFWSLKILNAFEKKIDLDKLQSVSENRALLKMLSLGTSHDTTVTLQTLVGSQMFSCRHFVK